MSRLTNRQKELFQQDKYVLVDTIIILEQKLEKAVKEIQFTKNELFLCGEAYIEAQQELDGDSMPEKMTEEQSKQFHDDLNEMIVQADAEKLNKEHNDVLIKDIEKQLDKAWEGEITSLNFVVP